jgi:DNA (cytosine-5)-methyltransferase 1
MTRGALFVCGKKFLTVFSFGLSKMVQSKKEKIGGRELKKHLTLGSFFDGIGGWLLASTRAGIEPLWSSEIEPFPESITRKHFPHVTQLGDITKIDPDTLPPVDIVCSGSPCQGLSTAGKRRGLKDVRSGLFLEAIKLVRELRRRTNGKNPRFFVWENVPGAFSSNKGMDFHTVLEEIGETSLPVPPNARWADAGLVELPICDIAWRILDAQYWGVPQRRKRIFLIADFGKDRRCAAKALFESESVCGNLAQGKGARESASGGSETSVRDTVDVIYDIAHSNDVVRVSGNKVTPTLAARMGTGGHQVPLVQSYCIAGNTIERQIQNGGNGTGVMSEKSYTLNTIDRHAVAKIFAAQSFSEYAENKCAALRATGGNHGGGSESLVVDSLSSEAVGNIVRRLTPLECERLQALPDGWTEGGSDSARYKALGNGMCQACADFVLQRIVDCAD